MEKNTQNKLRIAITGHREIPPDNNLFLSTKQIIKEITNNQPKKEILLYSALAEGSDQFAAVVAQDFQQVRLVVLLPLPIGEYLKDFYSQEGKEVFLEMLQSASEVIPLPIQENHLRAYQQLGEYLVEHCDVFIAIWDGEVNGNKGGTGEVVKKAKEAGKKIYWIYCENSNGSSVSGNEEQKPLGSIQIING